MAPIPSSVRFWLFIIPLIPSLVVTIFVLYHLLNNQALRRALNNHVIVLLLSCGLIDELTDVIFSIHFYRTNTALSSTPAFCFTWVYCSTSMMISVYLLMAWASIERHILIFHSGWLSTTRKRLFFHYLPPAICILWPLSFYFVVFFIVPCDVSLKYNVKNCGRTGCITALPRLALFDSIVNFIMPPFIIVIFSVSLLIRVIWHKYHMRQRVEWKNYKKMAVQLLPISVIYIVLLWPIMILYALYSAGLPKDIASDYYSVGVFTNYWVIMFTPLVSAVSLPELRSKCRNIILFWRKRRVVGPDVLPITARRAGGTRTVAVINQ